MTLVLILRFLRYRCTSFRPCWSRAELPWEALHPGPQHSQHPSSKARHEKGCRLGPVSGQSQRAAADPNSHASYQQSELQVLWDPTPSLWKQRAGQGAGHVGGTPRGGLGRGTREDRSLARGSGSVSHRERADLRCRDESEVHLINSHLAKIKS